MRDSIKKAIDEFNRRIIYKSLDPTVLVSLSDDKLEQAIVDYVTTKLEGKHDKEQVIIGKLPIGARALWLTWIVDGEVNNGGFNQYYWNTEGRFADEAVDAFRFFSATEHALLMEEANRLRAKERERIKKFEDRGTLEAFSESYEETKLGALDDRFYSLKEDLSALRIAKIRAEPELFSGE